MLLQHPYRDACIIPCCNIDCWFAIVWLPTEALFDIIYSQAPSECPVCIVSGPFLSGPCSFSKATIIAMCPAGLHHPDSVNTDAKKSCHHVWQPPTATNANCMFVPWILKPIQVDKMTVKLYQVVGSTKKLPERAHSFQLNKTALAAPSIDRHMMLNTIGAQLNLSAIVDSVHCNSNRHWHHS